MNRSHHNVPIIYIMYLYSIHKNIRFAYIDNDNNNKIRNAKIHCTYNVVIKSVYTRYRETLCDNIFYIGKTKVMQNNSYRYQRLNFTDTAVTLMRSSLKHSIIDWITANILTEINKRMMHVSAQIFKYCTQNNIKITWNKIKDNIRF